MAKATEKREARRARKHSKESMGDQQEPGDGSDPNLEGAEGMPDDTAGDDAEGGQDDTEKPTA